MRKKRDEPIYEKLMPNQCYIICKTEKSLLVATNKNGEGIKLKWLRIPK